MSLRAVAGHQQTEDTGTRAITVPFQREVGAQEGLLDASA